MTSAVRTPSGQGQPLGGMPATPSQRVSGKPHVCTDPDPHPDPGGSPTGSPFSLCLRLPSRSPHRTPSSRLDSTAFPSRLPGPRQDEWHREHRAEAFRSVLGVLLTGTICSCFVGSMSVNSQTLFAAASTGYSCEGADRGERVSGHSRCAHQRKGLG